MNSPMWLPGPGPDLVHGVAQKPFSFQTSGLRKTLALPSATQCDRIG